MGRNEAIVVIDIPADTLPSERRAEYAIEHVPLDEKISVSEPRRQFLHEPATLVGHRQRVEVQGFREQPGVSRIGLADFLQRTQVLADLLIPVPTVASSPALRQHPHLEEELEGLFEHDRCHRHIAEERHGESPDDPDLVLHVLRGLFAGFLDRFRQQHGWFHCVSGRLQPMIDEEIPSDIKRVIEVRLHTGAQVIEAA